MAAIPHATRCGGALAGGLAIAAMALASSACSRAADSGAAGSVAPVPCPPAGARVAVYAQGTIRLNGTEVAPAALAVALRSLAPPPVLVCYYREAGPTAAPAAPEVLAGIMSMRLPVLLFEDAAFARGVPPR